MRRGQIITSNTGELETGSKWESSQCQCRLSNSAAMRRHFFYLDAKIPLEFLIFRFLVHLVHDNSLYDKNPSQLSLFTQSVSVVLLLTFCPTFNIFLSFNLCIFQGPPRPPSGYGGYYGGYPPPPHGAPGYPGDRGPAPGPPRPGYPPQVRHRRPGSAAC